MREFEIIIHELDEGSRTSISKSRGVRIFGTDVISAEGDCPLLREIKDASGDELDMDSNSSSITYSSGNGQTKDLEALLEPE